MSTSAVVLAAQSILQTTIPEATVLLGIHRTIPEGEMIVYMYHDGSQDVEKAGPQNVQRTHTIPIHVLLRVAVGDADDVAETQLMGLHDRICDAFYAHHTLDGTCANAVMGQRDQPRGAAAGAYVYDGTSEYRHRWWTLTAVEQLSFVIS